MQIEGKTHRTYHMMLALTLVVRDTENIDQLLTVPKAILKRRIPRLRKIYDVESDAADHVGCILVHGSS